MRFVHAASARSLPPGARLAVEAGGRAIALFNVGGRLFAIEDRCGHEFMPLHDGTLDGTRISCRWHGWTYELDPAKRAAGPWPRATHFDVKVEGGEVYVGLPEPDERTSCASCPGRSTQ